MDNPCTMTRWRVSPDAEAEFLHTAHELAEVLLQLPGRPGELTLVQSVDDASIFHSVGWFHSPGDLAAMREDAEARRLLDRMVTLSAECSPSAHRVVYSTA
jgi:hypothetical protein